MKIKNYLKSFWKYFIGLSWVIILFVYIGYLIFIGFQERNININPAIYPIFRKIEIEAFECVKIKSKSSNEYAKCKKVADRTIQEYFSNSEFRPTSKEWYDFLFNMGYDLPTYRLKDKATEEEYKKAMKEQEELKKILYKLIKVYTLE